jgi:hypothetical protein
MLQSNRVGVGASDHQTLKNSSKKEHQQTSNRKNEKKTKKCIRTTKWINAAPCTAIIVAMAQR